MSVIDRIERGELVAAIYSDNIKPEDKEAACELYRLARIGERMIKDAEKCKKTYTDNCECECEYEGCLAREICWPETPKEPAE